MTCKSKWIVASVLLLSTLLMNLAIAGSMRCGTHIISDGGRHGPDKFEVLKKCGEPTARSGNTWIYEQVGGARRVVVFNASSDVARIE